MITTSDNGGEAIKLSYHKALDLNPLLFLVDINENKEGLPSRLLVKISQNHPERIHKECADLGIAPKLYGFEVLPSGWHMVVMEYMVGYKTLEGFRSDVRIRDGVKNTINKLHSRGYVHSDIREVNVMVREPGEGSPLHVFWDWAGRDGMVNYPI